VVEVTGLRNPWTQIDDYWQITNADFHATGSTHAPSRDPVGFDRLSPVRLYGITANHKAFFGRRRATPTEVMLPVWPTRTR
jgi:hypothetical protein